MNRKAFAERLREIKMSEYDAQLYEQYAAGVRRHVQTLRTILSSLQAKSKDRTWLKNQTSGELDDNRYAVIRGWFFKRIAGEDLSSTSG